MNDSQESPPAPTLEGRHVLVGVCGGIAAFKMASVVSGLVQRGATVDVAMTASATRFVTALTFQALSGRPVFTDLWDQFDGADPQHIRLADRLDAALVAPCTMNTLARLVAGFADDAVSTILAAVDRDEVPVLLAPSMNSTMWSQPSTVRNLEQLRRDRFQIVEPESGWQACRRLGPGRLPEPDTLISRVESAILVD